MVSPQAHLPRCPAVRPVGRGRREESVPGVPAPSLPDLRPLYIPACRQRCRPGGLLPQPPLPPPPHRSHPPPPPLGLKVLLTSRLPLGVQVLRETNRCYCFMDVSSVQCI